MDLIDQQLATKHKLTAKYDFAIRTAMGLAKKTLNKYYELTDSSEAYRIAMSTVHFRFRSICPLTHNLVLHPSFKMTYFERAGWLPEWIQEAHNIIRKQYDRKYADLPVPERDEDQDAHADDEWDNMAHSQVCTNYLSVVRASCTHAIFFL